MGSVASRYFSTVSFILCLLAPFKPYFSPFHLFFLRHCVAWHSGRLFSDSPSKTFSPRPSTVFCFPCFLKIDLILLLIQFLFLSISGNPKLYITKTITCQSKKRKMDRQDGTVGKSICLPEPTTWVESPEDMAERENQLLKVVFWCPPQHLQLDVWVAKMLADLWIPRNHLKCQMGVGGSHL